MKNVSLIVIDPQVGFCSPSGSLGLSYGVQELSEIEKVIPNIQSALRDSYRRHLVISEYAVGQFTNGDLEHPLANLCVPSLSEDCDVLYEFASVHFDCLTTKHQQSAMFCADFRSAIEHDLAIGIRHFVVAGFLLDHCVKSTAVDLKDSVSLNGIKVSVCSDLSATRLEKYNNGVVSETMDRLRSLGIQFELWETVMGLK